MLKRLMRSQVFLSGAGALAANYIRLVFNTARVIREPADLNARLARQAPFIAAMWHGQFLMIPAASPKTITVRCMVARHDDAEIVARALQNFGHDLIRGAGAGARERRKDRGGVAALRGALKTLEEGDTVAMTADVPPGPARIAGLGIVTLARMSGRPIIPVATATGRFLTFDTWSRFTVNLPFARLAVVTGEPVHVAPDASAEEMEAARRAVETGLNAATRRAYELAGADVALATPLSAGGRVAPGFILKTYRAITRVMRPIAGSLLRRRCQRGKEGRERPDLGILLTTVTVTSASIAAARLPKGAIHQFVPLDSPAFVARFLDHWRPDLALFTESEIWPNLILEADKRGIPLALLNARMSDRSSQRWVKFDAPPPPIDAAELSRLRQALRGRPVFLAASTHPGEDEIVARAHKVLCAERPNLLTIIVPRHPERGASIAMMAENMGLTVARRSAGGVLSRQTGIYVGDTIGELGLYYSLAPLAFIGGSLVPHGGQNPIEAVKLGTGVIAGPHWHNFPDVYKAIAHHDGCRFVMDGDGLVRAATELFDDPGALAQMREGAAVAVAGLGGAMERTLEALEPFLPPKAAADIGGAAYAP
jgi:3-deoxy-D-manno-octulosonic-acid transferase